MTIHAKHASSHWYDEPRPNLGIGILLTAVVWLLSRAVVTLRWPAARNPLNWNPSLWFRWDSSNYVEIARHGRTFGYCGTPGFSEPFARTTWCGSAGWFPGYPWTIQVLHGFGIGMRHAGMIISFLAFFVAIFLAWFGWARSLPLPRAFLILVLFAVFPGVVYNFAIFPIALTLALITGALLAASKERFLIMALLLNAAAICYPSACFAILGITVGLVILTKPRTFGATAKRVLWGASGLLSVVALFLHDQIAFGHFAAFIQLQNEAAPSSSIIPGIPRSFLNVGSLEQTGVNWLIAQMILAFAIMVIAAVLTWKLRNRWAELPLILLPLLAGFVLVLGLLYQGTAGSWYRSIAIAAPAALALRSLPLKFLVPLTIVTAGVTAVVSIYFFNRHFI